MQESTGTQAKIPPPSCKWTFHDWLIATPHDTLHNEVSQRHPSPEAGSTLRWGKGQEGVAVTPPKIAL